MWPRKPEEKVPLYRYDRYFGGEGGAEKAMASMKETYSSPKKAKQVFYALKNQRKGEGKSVRNK